MTPMLAVAVDVGAEGAAASATQAKRAIFMFSPSVWMASVRAASTVSPSANRRP